MGFEAAAELCLVLRRLGVEAQVRPTPLGVELPGGGQLRVVDRGQPALSQVERLVARPAGDRQPVLVVDRVDRPHQRVLREGGWGWLDRRGRVVVPSLDLDAPIAPIAAPPHREPDPWRRPSVTAMAICLLQLDPALPTLELAYHAGVSPNAAGQALRLLNAEGLIDDEGHAVDRARLRQELAARWRPAWRGVAALPEPHELDPALATVLGAGLKPLEGTGAARLPPCPEPAPSPEGETGPPRLLLADHRALGWLLRTVEEADAATAPARVAVAPSACATRRRHQPAVPGSWPEAHPAVADLDRLAVQRTQNL